MRQIGRNVSDREDILAREIIRQMTGGKSAEFALAEEFLEEIDVRLEQVKLYLPITELLRKRKWDVALLSVIPEFVFLLLAYFIYEGKLKNRGLSFAELERFIGQGAGKALQKDLTEEAARQLTAELLDGLQNGGRNFILNGYHFKSGTYREKYVKLLEIKQLEDGSLAYYVTEQGVDFYLKTKEFPDETKVTINLLLFQKQMEKGAFGFAYETVRRLNMEVQKKKEQKYSLLEALIYGQLDSGEAYTGYHQSIMLQFREEGELFDTAKQNIAQAYSEYVEKIQKGLAQEKEVRTFTLIKIIEKEMERAQRLHTELLQEAVKFTKEYDNALRIRRKGIFTERFSFQGEFEKLIQQNKTPGSLKFLFEPLMKPNTKKFFNPLRIFELQRIVRTRQEEDSEGLAEIAVGRMTMDAVVSRRVRKNFVFYAEQLLAAIEKSRGQVRLAYFCRALVDKYSEDSIYNGDFISFLLEMNRDKPAGVGERIIDFTDSRAELDEELKTIEAVFGKAAYSRPFPGRVGRVKVKSFPEQEIELLPGLKITDMLFIGE